jgi:endonuclease/exonuclease/phosphatase family metal-dependent hydrolase
VRRDQQKGSEPGYRRSMLKVATLNIWNRFGPWDERLPAIRTRLAELGPDVIGLQEVLRSTHGDRVDQVELLTAGTAYHAAWGLASDAHGFPVGNAILSRWPILRSETFPLPHGGTDERRSLVFAEIDAPFGKLPFFVTHLNWKLHHGHVRCEQVRFVAQTIQRMCPIEGFPPVVVGDFNAEPDSDEIRYMRGLTGLGGPCVYFADTFGVTGDGSPGITFARNNPFAAQVHEPDRRIDYVFVRGPDDRYRGEPLSARVCFDEPVNGVLPSDHYGVVATLST